MLGLGSSLVKGGKVGRTYVKDGLKLYMPYRGSDLSKGTQFVGTGSTYFTTNDYIDIDVLEDDISSDTAGTISMWIKPDDGQPSARMTLVALGDTNANEIILFEITTAGLILAKCIDGGTAQWTVDTDVAVWSNAESTWKHICLTQDGIAPVLYVDGLAVAQAFSVTTDKTDWMNTLTGIDNCRIGCDNINSAGNDNFLSGSMKNVAIWSRALTATEVQNVMYKSYVNVSGRLASGLVSWWSLDATDSLGSELITNGDMEANTTWNNTGSPTTQEQSSADKYSGTYSWHVAGADSNEGISSQTDGTGDFTTVTAKIYKINFWYKVVSGSFDIGWQPGDNGGVIDNITSTSYSTTSWTEVSYNYTETAGGSQADIRFMSDTSGAEFYLDDVSIKEINIEDLKGSNDGTIYGATVDEDLYGGDTPVIPRAIDNARTVQADAIGAGSASLDGVDDYIQIGAVGSLGSSCTICMWINRSTTAGYDYLFDARAGSGAGHAYGESGSTTLTKSAGTIYINGVASSAITTAEWCHVAITGITFTIGTGLRLGSSSTGSHFFVGNMCQIGIWSAVLTQAQIQSVMEKTFEELTASEKTNLVSYWALDEKEGGFGNMVVDKVDETFGSELSNNGDMENDSADWIDYGTPTTNTLSAEQVHSGSKSRKIVTDGGYEGIKHTGLTTVTGEKYKLDFWIYPVVDTDIGIELKQGASGSSELKISGSNTTAVSGLTVGTWNNIVLLTDAEPAGGSNAIIGIYQVTSGRTFYLDDISFKAVNGNAGQLI